MIFENEELPVNRQYKKRDTTTYSSLGKLPPSAIELEESILSTLINITVKPPIFATIKSEMFYSDKNQMICKAILQLNNEGSPIDVLTVQTQLKKDGNLERVGGMYALLELDRSVGKISGLEYNIAVIHEKFLSRELIRLSTEMINNCYDDTSNPLAEIAKIITEADKLKKGIFKRAEKDTTQLINELIEEMAKPKVDGLLGHSTGILGLDHITKGDKKGTLRVVAAATSIGKSIEMCSEVINGAFDSDKKLKPEKYQIPSAVFSLEMTSLDLTFRFVSNISKINSIRIQTDQLNDADKEHLNYKLNEFKQAKIFIDDTPGLNIVEFETKAAMLVALGVERFYIDYYQLMKGDPNTKYGTREQELSDIAMRLKICAKDLDIVIILLAQVGDLDKKPGGLYMPGLNDLRDCKALGLHADIVLFIWRPETNEGLLNSLKGTSIFCQLFNITLTEFENMCFFIVAKNRNGKLGKVPMNFNGGYMVISDHYLVKEALNSANFQPELTPNEREDKF